MFCRVSLLYSCIHIFSNIETRVNTVESLLEYVAKPIDSASPSSSPTPDLSSRSYFDSTVKDNVLSTTRVVTLASKDFLLSLMSTP